MKRIILSGQSSVLPSQKTQGVRGEGLGVRRRIQRIMVIASRLTFHA